jgi:hypothetical protein
MNGCLRLPRTREYLGVRCEAPSFLYCCLMNNCLLPTTALDPTKLKARQFSRKTEEKSTISTLWTETPAERQARLADEIMGKRKRAEISAGANTRGEETDDDRKRRRRDLEISKTIEEHNVGTPDSRLCLLSLNAPRCRKWNEALLWSTSTYLRIQPQHPLPPEI